ncbi:GNAT family N-acetyltransferase [Mycoplasma sp. P36-A1]|uniref:GNAT family N-acetyltransferase n=1 Tax=Mycoplasma sp. P36-A1 TaxID=3252900 RepID=UPI003C30D850
MIEKATDKDINQIMTIWLDINIKTHYYINSNYWYDNFDYVKAAINNSDIYLYKVKNEIVGFIGLTNNYIAGIFIKEDYQKKGIGQLLINHVKNNNSTLELTVYQKNKQAISFYFNNDFLIKDKSLDEINKEIEYTMIWNKQ